MPAMRTFLLVVIAALAVAPSAAAKGPVQVCGARACVRIAPEGAAAAPFVGVPVDAARLAPPPVGPYFVIRFSDLGGVLSYWIPTAGVLRFVAQGAAAWIAPSGATADALARATAALAPKRTPTTVGFASVGGQIVPRPRGYLRLYSLGTRVADPGAAGGGWLPVYLYGTPETPWTDGFDSLAVSRKGSFLRRDGQVVRIPAAIARKVRARQPL